MKKIKTKLLHNKEKNFSHKTELLNFIFTLLLPKSDIVVAKLESNG